MAPDDLKVIAAVHYLRHGGVPDGTETEELLEQVLDRVKQIGKTW